MRLHTSAAIAVLALTSAGICEAQRPRTQIVPRIDHHQHVIGPEAVAHIAPPPQLPVIELPDDLARLIRDRERVSGTEDVSVFAPDALILDISEAEDHWVRGKDAVARMVAAYQPDTPFLPTAYHAEGNSGFIAGIVGVNPTAPTMHFMLGLRKNDAGAWRIAVEYATLKPPLEHPAPLTADKTIQVLDDAGIERAAVFSVAYWLGDGSSARAAPGEYDRVRRENDWMAAQVARFPARLVGFCGVNPLKDYATDEVRRCARLPGVKGMKVHFGNSGVDVLDPGHVEKLRGFFRVANESRMAIAAHLWIRDREYGARHTRAFVNEILPYAPEVTVQIAHLGGAGRYAYDSVTAVFVDAIRAGKPAMKNVYFDLATVITERQSQATIDLIARRIREIGLDRIVFGADTPAGTRPEPISAWATIRRRLPLTDKELETMAGNVAPYLR